MDIIKERLRLEKERENAKKRNKQLIYDIEALKKKLELNKRYLSKYTALVEKIELVNSNLDSARSHGNSAVNNLNSNFGGKTAEKISSSYTNSFDDISKVKNNLKECYEEATRKKTKYKIAKEDTEKQLNKKKAEKNRGTALINSYTSQINSLGM